MIKNVRYFLAELWTLEEGVKLLSIVSYNCCISLKVELKDDKNNNSNSKS